MTLASLSIRRVAVSLLCTTPLLALAHSGGEPGHFHSVSQALAAGFTHPFSGLDHLAAMVVLGMWSAMTSRRVWLAPLAFASMLLVGALLGLVGVSLPAVEPMIAASLLALGLLLATGLRLPALAGAAVAAVFALFHGVAHGVELAGPQAAFAIAGMVAATALLHGVGVGIGLAMQRRSVWLPRAIGAAVALTGVVLFAPLA